MILDVLRNDSISVSNFKNINIRNAEKFLQGVLEVWTRDDFL